MSRYRNFCITVNNYKENDIQKLMDIQFVKYGIIGKEIGEKGTPHLQGYLQLTKKQTISAFQKKLKKREIKCAVFGAKGSADQNLKYCKKEGAWTEWGEIKRQGKRSDLNEMYEMITDKCSNKEIREKMPNTYMKYYKAVDRVRADLQQEESYEDLKKQMDNQKMRKWQKKVLKYVKRQDNRKVTWVYDPLGNSGKTWLAKWMVANENTYYVQGGKSADISYAYNNQEYVIFDFTRSQEERINYSTIESFKNGLLFSPKYESKMKVFKSAKVLCLSNFYPDVSKLSQDRWEIVSLEDSSRA